MKRIVVHVNVVRILELVGLFSTAKLKPYVPLLQILLEIVNIVSL